MSWSKAEASRNISLMLVTPEVSHAPMSSLKDAAASLQTVSSSSAQNKFDMSVTPPVPHIEMWPYVASAAALSESQSLTAFRILMSVITQTPCRTPHDVDAHGVLSNA